MENKTKSIAAKPRTSARLRPRPRTLSRPPASSNSRATFRGALVGSISGSPFDVSTTLERLRLEHSERQSADDFDLVTEKKQDLNPPCELPSKTHKQEDSTFVAALQLLKGVLFKRDQPYRTRLPLQGNFPTNGSGVLNVTTANASLAGVSEWASISALFDEFFIHSFTVRFIPYNNLGGGVGYSAGALTTGGITATADTQINNCAMLVCCLFNNAPTYTTASAMAANATAAIKYSSKSWTYSWRNSVRFDRRGENVTMGSTIGYQGWTNTSSPSSYGGAIQYRFLNDAVVGSGSAVVNLGSYITYWDVSFRARS
jgi:hypothetical protein